MSDTKNIDEVLQRIELMLDTLKHHSHSSIKFETSCKDLQAYLDDQSSFFAAPGNLSKVNEARVLSIIDRLDRLQRHAATKASIPNDLQKYIAEQLD